VTFNINEYSLVSIASVIITIIVYAFTSVINFGYAVRVVVVKVIKLGREPVAESLTTDTLVVAPLSGSVIEGNG
jgi:hypothetical protein